MSKAKTDTRNRWLVVFAAAVGISVSSVNTYSLGVFVAPLQAEFGWSRANIMLGMTISAIAGTLFGPLIGILVDRVGPRRIGILGVTTYCLTTAMLGLATASIGSWWGLWILVASTAALIKPVVWTAPISALFDRKRGLAMSLALAGTGLASTFAPWLAEALILRTGWRIAYLIIGGGWGLFSIPILLLFFHGETRRGDVKSVLSDLPGLRARDGFRSAWFYKLLLTTLLATLMIISMMVNIVPMMHDGGLASSTAAKIAGIAGLASITGRIGCGMMLDRWHGPWVGAGMFLLPCIACVTLLIFGVHVWSAVVVVILLGLSIGAELDIVAYLSSRYFGRHSYGTLFGTVSSMLSAGTAIGPPLAAYVSDSTGSYVLWWWLMIPVSLCTSLLVASLGRYPNYAVSTAH